MDLVMMAENDPPVCKIMDYGKHVFESKKQKAAQRKRAKRTQIKEMKFRPGTEEGDYQVKLRNLVRFLENGDKAKVTLRYRKGKGSVDIKFFNDEDLQRILETLGVEAD